MGLRGAPVADSIAVACCSGVGGRGGARCWRSGGVVWFGLVVVVVVVNVEPSLEVAVPADAPPALPLPWLRARLGSREGGCGAGLEECRGGSGSASALSDGSGGDWPG
ncbi:hypothetical protein M758_7G050300 [Ceratodon purpureus]|nr:hypothetical protein M758_7G050300 [Ceratodon purpureus]